MYKKKEISQQMLILEHSSLLAKITQSPSLFASFDCDNLTSMTITAPCYDVGIKTRNGGSMRGCAEGNFSVGVKDGQLAIFFFNPDGRIQHIEGGIDKVVSVMETISKHY